MLCCCGPGWNEEFVAKCGQGLVVHPLINWCLAIGGSDIWRLINRFGTVAGMLPIAACPRFGVEGKWKAP